jgi:hypothetical protein
MPRTKASAKAKRACEAAARRRERASRESTPEFEEDGVHSIYMLSSFCGARSYKKCFFCMGSLAGCSRPYKPTFCCTSSYTSIAVCIELSNSVNCRVEAFNKTLGTPIVTRAHKWRAQTANSDLTPNSAQEAARQVAKEDAVHHARMKAQQRDILKNELQKEKDLAIKANENRRRSAEQRAKQSVPLQGPTQSLCLSLAA